MIFNSTFIKNCYFQRQISSRIKQYDAESVNYHGGCTYYDLP